MRAGRYPPEDENDAPDPHQALLHASRSCGAGLGGTSSDGGGGNSSDACGGGLGAGGSCSPLLRSCSSGSSLARLRGRRARPLAYVPVVHCGSIRQAAQVVGMQELQCGVAVALGGGAAWGEEEGEEEQPIGVLLQGGEEGEGDAALELGEPEALAPVSSGSSSAAAAAAGVDAGVLAGAVAAAGVLQHVPPAPPGASPKAAHAHAEDLGCVARVRLRFSHHPEWLVPGARLVLRDRSSGRAAAGGYVSLVDAQVLPH